MKAVLISIKSKWCEKIASGEKTIDVRKTRPKLETPFKVYIYCTNGKPYLNWHNGKIYLEEKDVLGGRGVGLYKRLSGQVIGEFVCDSIDTYNEETIRAFSIEDYCRWNDFDLNRACMHPQDLEDYGKDSLCIYGWHISNLVIYDKPKELSEFFLACDKPSGTDCSKCYDNRENRCKSITRPPQSWCYVEGLE